MPERVHLNISSESGINDGLGYLFVLLPVLLISSSGEAWQELLTRVLLREVLGAALCTDAVLAVFVAAAVFGQLIPQQSDVLTAQRVVAQA